MPADRATDMGDALTGTWVIRFASQEPALWSCDVSNGVEVHYKNYRALKRSRRDDGSDEAPPIACHQTVLP